MVTERDAGLGQRGTAGRPCEQLDAEFGFQPEQPPADNGLRNAKPPSGRRYPASIGHGDKSPQIFQIHPRRSTFSDTEG